VPPVTAPRTRSGGEIRIGSGAFFPFAFFGTTAGLPAIMPAAAFVGPYGETLRDDTVPAQWEAFDAAGTRISGGTIDPNRGAVPAAAPNGSRLVVRREWRHATGLTTRGTLEVAFAPTGSDLTAPTITSLRIADSTGTATARLAQGAAASLHFSAADLDHAKRMELKPTKSEATRAAWRRAGASEWTPLSLGADGFENGSVTTLGHVPAGDLHRADLSAAALVPGLVDLRIDLEDLAGNRVVWTQEGALFVGADAAEGTRSRPARRP
jgi:hypothetical protein